MRDNLRVLCQAAVLSAALCLSVSSCGKVAPENASGAGGTAGNMKGSSAAASAGEDGRGSSYASGQAGGQSVSSGVRGLPGSSGSAGPAPGENGGEPGVSGSVSPGSGASQKYRDYFDQISFSNPIPRLKNAVPASSPVVIGVPEATQRWQRYMLAAFQGLANRKQARIFLNWETSDLRWMDRWKAPDLYGFSPDYRTASDVHDMMMGDADYYNVRGLLIYDEDIINREIWSTVIHVYTGICAAENLIPVPAGRAADFPGMKVLFDARGSKALGKWADETEAYRWVVDAYPDLTKKGRPMAVQHPSCLREVDYYVMNRMLPIYYWSGCPQSVKDIYEQIFLKTGANGLVVGTWDIPTHSSEHSARRDKPAVGNALSFVPAVADGEPGNPEHIFVYLISGYGKSLLTTAEKGVQNMSFHEGLPLKPSKPAAQPAVPSRQGDKKYVALHVSDGDNMCYVNEAYDTTFGLTTDRWWGQAERGSVNISWSVAPGAADLLPGVVSYLFKTATPQDSFIGAVSGWGYMLIRAYGVFLPPGTRDGELARFFKSTGEYQKKLNTTSQHAIWSYLKNYTQNRNAQMADMAAAASAVKSANPAFGGFFMEYGVNSKRAVPAQYTLDYAGSVPLFNAVNSLSDHLDIAANMNAAVNAVKRAPADIRNLHVFCANWFVRPSSLKTLCERLGPEYAAVSANHLALLLP